VLAASTSIAALRSSRFDTIIEWLLIALLAFMPLAFGVVEAWSELAVILLAEAIVVCLALKLVTDRAFRFVWTWAYAPIGLFFLLAISQLIPLPLSWVAVVSPHTAALKTQLLGDLPNADALLKTMTLSFYPLATRHDIRLVLVAAVVFVVVLNVHRRPEQIKRLLGAIAVIGGAVALLALAQTLLGNGKIYWVVPTRGGLANSGPFVNHSNYGQFMNLSIGAALGLLLMKLHEGFKGIELTLPNVIERLGEHNLRVVWYLGGMIVLGAASIFVSLTRGGIIALLIAGSFTTLVIASKRDLKYHGWITTAIAVAAFACVLYVGFDAVYERLATLRDMHKAQGGRWQIVKDIALAWTRFPALGTGLGTHAVVYPMFDRSTIPALAYHAENEYAQLAEETGAAGLGLALAFLGIVWWNYGRCVRRLVPPVRAAAFGLGMGLLAVMIQSLSDFGQHLPANFSLTAVACALVVGLAQMGRESRAGSPRWSRLAGALGLLAVLAAGVWAILGANRARVAEAHWRTARRLETRLRKANWRGTNAEYAQLIEAARAAAEAEPGNIKYRHWLGVYRWRSISRVRDPETGQVVMTPRTLAFAERIVERLHRARALCPTFGATYCVAGQLERFVLKRPEGARHIRTGLKLAPCDPTAWYVAGLLDIHEGRTEASLEKFRRAITLDGRLRGEVLDVYLEEADRPDLALEIAGDDMRALLHLANALHERPGIGDLEAKARKRAIALLRTRCEAEDAPAWCLAQMAWVCLEDENWKAAVQYYRRALDLDYARVRWRYNLARALAASGRVSEAIREARICLRLRPQMDAAKKLIADLSVLPGTVSEK